MSDGNVPKEIASVNAESLEAAEAVRSRIERLNNAGRSTKFIGFGLILVVET